MTWFPTLLKAVAAAGVLGVLALSGSADLWDDLWDGGTTGGHAPHGHSAHLLGNATSTNWSGYALVGNVSGVKADFVQPAIDCAPTGEQAASFWVGLDGVVSKTVEQIGTQVVCEQGVVTYGAFWETFPANSSHTIPGFVVRPGDHLTASVNADNGHINLRLVDHTSGSSFSNSLKLHVALASAEVIVERPSTCPNSGCEVALPEFGTATFSRVSIEFGDGSYLGDVATAINMQNSGGARLATVSQLDLNMRGFTVTWNASN